MRPQRSRGVDALLSAVGVLAAVAAGVVLAGRIMSWTDDDSAPVAQAHRAHQSARAFACAAPAEIADDYCRRLVRDWSRRKDLSNADRMRAGSLTDQVRTAVVQANQCSPPAQTCFAERAPTAGPARFVRSADPARHADEIRRALGTAGFPDATVRPAESDDPAPEGSVVYAVRIELHGRDADAACIVGYRDGEGEGGGPSLVGTLPDGRCLVG